MKLWLDDIREPPGEWVDIDTARDSEEDLDCWVWVKTSFDALVALNRIKISECSFDHDLGEDTTSGYDVVKYMAENDIWPDIVKVHSMNPVGRQNMLQLIKRYKP